MKRMRRFGSIAILLSAVLTLPACILAAAGAGGGGGIYFTSRGVQSVVAAPVETVATATNQTFDHFAITQTELVVKKDGARQQFIGKPGSGDPEVTVSLRRKGASVTKVQVTARNSAVTWDKEYARTVMQKIVEYSKG